YRLRPQPSATTRWAWDARGRSRAHPIQAKGSVTLAVAAAGARERPGWSGRGGRSGRRWRRSRLRSRGLFGRRLAGLLPGRSPAGRCFFLLLRGDDLLAALGLLGLRLRLRSLRLLRHNRPPDRLMTPTFTSPLRPTLLAMPMAPRPRLPSRPTRPGGQPGSPYPPRSA